MRKLRIGFLFPYSGVFTKLKTDFKAGFDLALKIELPLFEYDSVGEYINLGNVSEVEAAINKLIAYEDVDLIIGIAGTRVIINAKELYEKHKIPLIVNNLGGYIPTHSFRSEYLFYNSLDLWRSEFVIGNWAQRKFSGYPFLSTSIYETGYHMQECFRVGGGLAGAPYMKADMTKNITGDPDTQPLINSIIANAPPYVHASLSGKEGKQFLENYKKSAMLNNLPLSTGPFMVDECIELTDKDFAGVYSACSWSYLLENQANRNFVDHYENQIGKRPHAYSMLAFETGLVLCEALKGLNGQGYTGAAIAKQLTTARAEGPRGKISVTTTPAEINQPVYIRKSFYDHKEGIIKNEIIDTSPAPSWDNPDILNIAYQSSSGWDNPYLCV